MWINKYVRSGQSSFSSFLIWLSAGDWLIPGGERRGWELSEVSFCLGVTGCHSVSDFSTRTRLWFGWPAGGEDCNLESPHVELRRSPGYVNELKLIWFGNFKIQFWILLLWHTGRMSSRCFSDTSIGRCGNQRTGRDCLLLLFRFCLLLYVESGCRFLFLLRAVDVNTRVGTLIVATIYLQMIQNRYMFRSITVLQCSHQHCVQPVANDVEVVGYL